MPGARFARVVMAVTAVLVILAMLFSAVAAPA
jgi:hypothetical protein